MKQRYLSINFSDEKRERIKLVNSIVRDYMTQGYVLTVRQLYYQLVARGHIENTERSYKNTTNLVNDARLAGLVDWGGIEDRTREFIRRSRWESGGAILKAVSQQFHMDHWEGQRNRVFVIVEKEALAGVLERVCHTLDVPLLAARGYPSGTVLREFAVSDLITARNDGQTPVILHLGDHDPSGIDMTRDLGERLAMFAETRRVELIRIALTMDQIEEQKPPPNPAKTTDSRFESYMEQYGDESWELDALTPEYLSGLVEQHILDWVDTKPWDERRNEIARIRERLEDAAARFDDEEAV